jgi:acetyl-CoA carboxylase carboxyltransferase component
VKLVVAQVPAAARAPEPAAVELSPLERLEALCDPGSLRLIRTAVERDAARSVPGDGVVAGAGSVAGRQVFCYAQDRSFMGGSLGAAHADTIVRVLQMAGGAGAPVVAFVESAGARMDEGTAALGGYGRIFRENVALSGHVPQITVVTGTSAGGGSYSPALTDFVVMTERASMFLTGPGVVSEVMGERVSKEELGGPRVHSGNGVCHLVGENDGEAVELARELLGYLPQSSGRPVPASIPEAPLASNPGSVVPHQQRQVYDVRGVIRCVADSSRLLEMWPRWARNMVTVFARVDGRPVGFVANQPRRLGGVIDVAASEKAARFVRTCNAYGLPLVVLVDTPGFLPGTRQESAGVIRHGAGLLRAFAEARVPKITVVLRKAFGGGYITMNSKDLGADLTLAWPDAEIGVVGPKQAVGFVHREELANAADPDAERERLAAAYAERHVSAAVAARQGFVDELIEPEETRERVAWALSSLGEGL